MIVAMYLCWVHCIKPDMVKNTDNDGPGNEVTDKLGCCHGLKFNEVELLDNLDRFSVAFS